MIHNDISRTKEFFLQPVKSGRAAREMTLSLRTILQVIFFAVVIEQIASHFLQVQSKSYTDQVRAQTPVPTDPMELQLHNVTQGILDWMFVHPFYVALLTFGLSLALIFIMGFVRGKQVEGFDLPKFYSAMARISLVKSLLNAVMIAIVGVTFMMSDTLGVNAQMFFTMISFLIFIWTLNMWQGALETETIWGALGVTVISIFGMAAVIFFFSMIATVVML